MITRRMKLRDAAELIQEGAIAVILWDNQIRRIHETKPITNPSMLACKLEFGGSYTKSELYADTTDVHIITGN